GGQFTLAGNKPSAYLAKWCAELDAGRCTFAFVPRASNPQPRQVPRTQIPFPSETLLPESTESASTVTITPTVVPAAAAPGAGGINTLWIGLLVLIFIVGCLSLILFRRA
ncbi:MAG: hypothetical protein JSV42_05895, partial [Chloroflexota bacterium]